VTASEARRLLRALGGSDSQRPTSGRSISTRSNNRYTNDARPSNNLNRPSNLHNYVPARCVCLSYGVFFRRFECDPIVDPLLNSSFTNGFTGDEGECLAEYFTPTSSTSSSFDRENDRKYHREIDPALEWETLPRNASTKYVSPAVDVARSFSSEVGNISVTDTLSSDLRDDVAGESVAKEKAGDPIGTRILLRTFW
jgi:hypothetical protein